MNLETLMRQIKSWGEELGFQDIAISDVDLSDYSQYLQSWLKKQFHGEMQYMAQNQDKRLQPALLHANTLRIITARMDYLPQGTQPGEVLKQPDKAYISRYALGRDYHKLIRKRLARLAEKINHAIAGQDWNNFQDLPEMQSSNFIYRAFTDSAPVLEKALAEKSGLGWIGKNTLLLNREAGSWFFLGEIFTNLPLPLPPASPLSSTVENKEGATKNHCGACQACIKVCPTNALVGANILDARKCISYLTIENPGEIPESLRPLMGNHIFGCDDCQLICPWNRFANHTKEADFQPRHSLENSDLLELFAWTEEEFLQRTQGSAIRRIKYWQWQRNIAVALGNASTSKALTNALNARLSQLNDADQPADKILKEHIAWALGRHDKPVSPAQTNDPGKPEAPG